MSYFALQKMIGLPIRTDERYAAQCTAAELIGIRRTNLRFNLGQKRGPANASPLAQQQLLNFNVSYVSFYKASLFSDPITLSNLCSPVFCTMLLLAIENQTCKYLYLVDASSITEFKRARLKRAL